MPSSNERKQELFRAARSAPAPTIEWPFGDWAKVGGRRRRKSESLFEQAKRAPRPEVVVEVPFGNNWSKINTPQTLFEQARRAPMPAPELPFGEWSRGRKGVSGRGPLLIEASGGSFEKWVGDMLRRSVE